MRLAVLALSAAAISGCSWYGGAGHHGTQPACHPAYASGYGYQQTQFGYAQGGANCVGGVYGAQGFGAPAGYAPQAYGAQGFGGQAFAGQGFGAQAYATQTYNAQPAYGAQGMTAQTQTMGGVGMTGTMLGASAPFGAAVGGATVGAQGMTQFASAGGIGAAGGAQTVIGAPIYVPQPYPAPYPVPQLRGPICCGVVGGGAAAGGAMPFGIEVFGGTDIDSSGKIFTKKSDGPPDGDFSIPIRVGEIDPIHYDEAFGAATTFGVAIAKDISPNTTVLGSISRSQSEGQTVENYTTVQDGTWAGGVFTPAPGSSPRHLDGTFSDLEQTTIEAGLRHYVGHNLGFRPYVGASAGMTHNNEVEFVQTFADDGSYYGSRQFIDSGWAPTAAATLGAELAISPRAAIGVESGVRWRDNMNTAAPSEDQITIPLTLRGRLAF